MASGAILAEAAARPAGRVYRGSPAPTNLVIPPHRYLSPTKIVVGENGHA